MRGIVLLVVLDPNVMYFTLNDLETHLLGKLVVNFFHIMVSLLKAGGLHYINLLQNFF